MNEMHNAFAQSLTAEVNEHIHTQLNSLSRTNDHTMYHVYKQTVESCTLDLYIVILENKGLKCQAKSMLHTALTTIGIKRLQSINAGTKQNAQD